MTPFALLLAATLAFNPFEKNDPLIDEGTALYEKGQFDQALAKFDEASRQYPQDARVPYNRGLALHKAGRNDEAKQAFDHAIELDRAGDGTLTAKAHYNLGNVAAQSNDKKTALKEYREALRRNPSDELARHNLEVVLRDLPPPQNGNDGGMPDAGKDAGTPDAGKPDAGRPDAGPDGGTDGGADGGAPDGGTPDGGGDGGAGDGGQTGDGGQGDGGQGQKDQKGDAGQQDNPSQRDGGGGDDDQRNDAGTPNSAAQLLPDGGVDKSKAEAEKLLDSMKNSEKNMQLWRFRQKQQKVDPNGKDW